MPLHIQADAIRVAILEKYGGIWMDTDIIITKSNFLKNVFKYDLAFFGYPQYYSPTIGFIYASKNSRIIKEWLINIIKKVSFYKMMHSKKYNDSKLKNIYKWNYLGNGIINELLKNANKKEFIIFDWVKMNAIPERNEFSGHPVECYRKFYFYPGDPHKIIYNNSGIIFLHNSWTEKKYKYMPRTEFLKQNIMLSSLLEEIINKNDSFKKL